jgi:hypothetical protein
MKTAMQELIDEIKEAVPYFKMDIYQPNFNKALEKEKYQIIYAYSEGYSDGVQEPNPNDNYYNERYQNK